MAFSHVAGGDQQPLPIESMRRCSSHLGAGESNSSSCSRTDGPAAGGGASFSAAATCSAAHALRDLGGRARPSGRDLDRLRPDGCVPFAGRRDDQRRWMRSPDMPPGWMTFPRAVRTTCLGRGPDPADSHARLRRLKDAGIPAPWLLRRTQRLKQAPADRSLRQAPSRRRPPQSRWVSPVTLCATRSAEAADGAQVPRLSGRAPRLSAGRHAPVQLPR